jgi:hypothetical protein
VEGVLSWLKFLIVFYGVHNERGAPPLWGDAGRIQWPQLAVKTLSERHKYELNCEVSVVILKRVPGVSRVSKVHQLRDVAACQERGCASNISQRHQIC